jgi:hypothetical protein
VLLLLSLLRHLLLPPTEDCSKPCSKFYVPLTLLLPLLLLLLFVIALLQRTAALL